MNAPPLTIRDFVHKEKFIFSLLSFVKEELMIPGDCDVVLSLLLKVMIWSIFPKRGREPEARRYGISFFFEGRMNELKNK